MIRLQKLTPSVYYSHSRDFQFIGRLYDLVLNAVKTNAELLYNLPLNDNSDDQWLDLTATTLGLELKNYYNVKQLKAICGSFAEVIKNKGNIQSIEKACNIVMHAEGIPLPVHIKQSEDLTELIVYVTNKLSDTALLRDLLNYILPAGVSCRIVKTFFEEAKASTVGWTTLLSSNDVQLADSRGLILQAMGTASEAEPTYTEELNEYGKTVIINSCLEVTNDFGTEIIL